MRFLPPTAAVQPRHARFYALPVPLHAGHGISPEPPHRAQGSQFFFPLSSSLLNSRSPPQAGHTSLPVPSQLEHFSSAICVPSLLEAQSRCRALRHLGMADTYQPFALLSGQHRVSQVSPLDVRPIEVCPPQVDIAHISMFQNRVG